MQNLMRSQLLPTMPLAKTDIPQVNLIGVPFGAGAGLAGCEFAPAAFRAHDLAGRIAAGGRLIAADADVAFSGELALLSVNAPARNVGAVTTALRATHRATWDALQAGEFPLILGGDHSISMGSVSAASRHARTMGKRVAVIWLDAHADFNTPETSPSGNMHGMSLAQLSGERSLANLVGPQVFTPIRPQDITIIGLRSVDKGEERALSATGIRCYNPAQVRSQGIGAVIDETLRRFDPATTHLHVSLDLDVMEPAFVPGVGTPVEDGLDPTELLEAAMMLAASGMMASADLVEFNPTRDREGRTIGIAIALCCALLGVPASA
ncbi:MAG: arginase [Rhabdaerophilum sp.]